jgi:hypothetical protein
MNVRPCERCGGNSLMIVPWMAERARNGWVGLGATDELEPMQTLICRGCGHVAWYCPPTANVRERREASRRIVDERLRCAGCDEKAHLLIAMLHELVSHGAAAAVVPLAVLREELGGQSGRFAVLVCDGCGRVSWFVCNVSVFAGEACEGACARCAARARHRIRPFVEEDGRPMPVGLRGREPVGELELSWCDGCGACDWRAHGIDWLDADGVYAVAAVDACKRDPLAGGPYR